MDNHLPNTQVLLEYLALHTKAREGYRKSTTDRFVHVAQKFTSYITAHDPVIDQLNAITNRAISNINNATTFDRCYELIFTLRAEAEKAQSLKTLNDVSLLSETLHGLADLIICELSTNEDFDKKMRDLQSEKIKKAEYINDCVDKSQGNNVTKANNEYTKVLLELANLGDIRSINEAMERNKLTHLKRPTITDLYNMDCLKQPVSYPGNYVGNQAAPLCLQLKFCEWLYNKEFQPITFISFKDFKERAIIKGNQEKLLANQTARDSLQALSKTTVPDDHREESTPLTPDTESTNSNITQQTPTISVDETANPLTTPTVSVTTNSVFVAKQLVSSPPSSPPLNRDSLDKERSSFGMN